MKEEKMATCPGCKKHCPACSPRCKYGKSYFEKRENVKTAVECGRLTGDSEENRSPWMKMKGRRTRKWEKNIVRGSLAWRLAYVGRKTAKAINRGKTTGDRLLGVLSPEEKESLAGILEKLGTRLDAEKET